MRIITQGLGGGNLITQGYGATSVQPYLPLKFVKKPKVRAKDTTVRGGKA